MFHDNLFAVGVLLMGGIHPTSIKFHIFGVLLPKISRRL